jgi:prepilin-type N-terminal cleavage/methylation domain-containing protein
LIASIHGENGMKGVKAVKRQILFLLSLHLRAGDVKGFTLLELLVAMLIGSIMSFIMLTGVIQLMGTNQKEAARSDTQRDAQAALDYISRDLREAIYVYDGRCLATGADRVDITPLPVGGAPAATEKTYCSALLNFLPASINGADQLPVLAFWRVDPLPEPLKTECRTKANAWVSPTIATTNPAFSRIPCASQTTYSLIVYSLDWSNPGNIWRGRARLKRYQLPQYEYAAAAAGKDKTETVNGWVSPLSKEIGFAQWPLLQERSGAITNWQTKTRYPTDGTPAGGGGAVSNTGVDNAVLIDFMDDEKFTADTANCPTDSQPPLQVSPPTTLATGNKAKRNFYACVRGGAGAGLNQEVIIRLQANAAGRPGISKIGGGNVPITMETRVLTRGVLNKGT